jgi:F0F1-type ATP synthase assembly protein I
MGNAARISAVGIELGGSIIVCLLAGSWADQRFGTAPYLALVGLLLGTCTGFLALWRAVKASQEDAEAEERRGGPEGGT